jgi:glucose/arabinose dehydrogenase
MSSAPKSSPNRPLTRIPRVFAVRGTRLILIAGLGAVALAAGLIGGCGGGDAGTPSAETAVTESQPNAQGVGGGGGNVRLAKVGDFDQPVFVAQPPGTEDLYVVEKPGRVQIVRSGGATPATALDISDKVATDSEQGLLSIAFDPDFASSRLVYAYYTGDDQDQRVVEFRVNDDGTFDAGSEREVLKMDDFAPNHNGGLLMFGPDGSLYIGTGDGGIGDDVRRQAQDLGSPLGKILRIDPHASGNRPYTPAGASNLTGRSGVRPEILAYGLRNPWRFSFDRGTAALVIGDVGQNTLEEVDYVPAEEVAGANFGWSAFEGTRRFNEDVQAPHAIAPIFTYGRDRGCSITGGYVVRDRELPSLSGRYLYGDYCAGELRSFVPSPRKASGDRSLGLEVPGLSSFAEDTHGYIYATSLNGPVFRLEAGG